MNKIFLIIPQPPPNGLCQNPTIIDSQPKTLIHPRSTGRLHCISVWFKNIVIWFGVVCVSWVLSTCWEVITRANYWEMPGLQLDLVALGEGVWLRKIDNHGFLLERSRVRTSCLLRWCVSHSSQFRNTLV